MNAAINFRRVATGCGIFAVAGLVAVLLRVTWYFERGDDEAEESGAGNPVEILVCGDPFADILRAQIPRLEEESGRPIHLGVRRYARTLETIRLNARDDTSFYGIVSFDVLWLPSLMRDGVLSPLTQEDLEFLGVERSDYYPLTWEINTVSGMLYGLPVQPHLELLWYRRDLLEREGFEPPETLQELLRQARHFHQPEEGIYGICWNGLRGQALGQTVSHLYAAFGGSVIGPGGELTISSAAGHQTLGFLLELMQVSPPDILAMAWIPLMLWPASRCSLMQSPPRRGG